MRALGRGHHAFAHTPEESGVNISSLDAQQLTTLTTALERFFMQRKILDESDREDLAILALRIYENGADTSDAIFEGLINATDRGTKAG